VQRVYIAIDLKSFYASAECIFRGLDPLDTNLVVADESRTDKTICLAVSPSLKAHGLPGRCRLFEVQRVLERLNTGKRRDAEESHSAWELSLDKSKRIGCIIAKPRMGRYIELSTRIYQTYLEFVAPEDIHVYSIDEVFIDATAYLKPRGLTPAEFARLLISTVYSRTGITATAGIGPNLYLCKVAMDIEAKHIPPDENGVRIAELDEMSYRERLWEHRPITDFWRVGRGYAKKLEAMGLYTMGDVALCSVYSEDSLYKVFGVNAELLIDHAWGYESCLMSDIKAYKPDDNSISLGQVLGEGALNETARILVREMADSLTLQLNSRNLTCSAVTLALCFEWSEEYSGPVTDDFYGRPAPKPVHANVNLPSPTASSVKLAQAVMGLFEGILNPSLRVRRIYLIYGKTQPIEDDAPVQLDMFTDTAEEEKADRKDSQMLKAVLGIQKKYGRNALIKGMDLQEGATTRERNDMIGGHRA